MDWAARIKPIQIISLLTAENSTMAIKDISVLWQGDQLYMSYVSYKDKENRNLVMARATPDLSSFEILFEKQGYYHLTRIFT